MNDTIRLEIWDCTLAVEFDYSPYEPPERRAANGDPPQYPGSPESVDICNIEIIQVDEEWCDRTEIEARINNLSKKDKDRLEEAILEHIHEQ